MTRAQQHLYLSHASTRLRQGAVRTASPSPFLSSISPTVTERIGDPVPKKRKPRQETLFFGTDHSSTRSRGMVRSELHSGLLGQGGAGELGAAGEELGEPATRPKLVEVLAASTAFHDALRTTNTEPCCENVPFHRLVTR